MPHAEYDVESVDEMVRKIARLERELAEAEARIGNMYQTIAFLNKGLVEARNYILEYTRGD